MKCDLDFDKLLAYSLGELDLKEAAELKRHTDRCEKCGRELKKIKELALAISDLPEVKPDERVLISLKGSLEQGQAISIATTLWLLRLLRRPAVLAPLIFLVALLVVLRITSDRQAGEPGRQIAVEEMGSRFAHKDLRDEDLRDILHSYLTDSERIASEALRYSASGQEADWRLLKAEIAETDMIYRALFLRKRLSDKDRLKVPGSEAEEGNQRALVDDTLDLFRAISDRSPEALVEEGNRLKTKVESIDLLSRLKRGR